MFLGNIFLTEKYNNQPTIQKRGENRNGRRTSTQQIIQHWQQHQHIMPRRHTTVAHALPHSHNIVVPWLLLCKGCKKYKKKTWFHCVFCKQIHVIRENICGIKKKTTHVGGENSNCEGMRIIAPQKERAIVYNVAKTKAQPNTLLYLFPKQLQVKINRHQDQHQHQH